MRIIAVLPILAFWGCSDDSSKSGSCPQVAVKVIEKVVKGSSPDPQEVQEWNSAMKNASESDEEACNDLVVANEQAWDIVYGKEGPSKMAAFKRLEGDTKKQAAAEFVRNLFMKIALGINGNSPPFVNNPLPFGNNPLPFGNKPPQFGNNPPPFGNNPLPFGNNPIPFGNNPLPFGNHQPPQFGNNPPEFGSCPANLEAVFRKVIEVKVIGVQEILGMDGAQPAHYTACAKFFLHNEKAWEFVHGNEGPSKMAAFYRLLVDMESEAEKVRREAAETDFIRGFLGKFQAIHRRAVAAGNLRQM
jgi:hypothetical protein